MTEAKVALLLPLLLAAGCDRATEPAAEPSVAATSAATPRPDLASCEVYESSDDLPRLRREPLAVPDELKAILASDYDHFAVLTLGGKTICLDMRWMESVEDLSLSEDERFLSFDWLGYESYGHQVIDRTGAGQAIDTGVAPTKSPSGKRLGAVEYSESGFGSLNAFAVWDVRPTGLAEVAKVEELPALAEWRLDRWTSEDCVELSAIAFDDMPEDYRQIDQAPRQSFVAREAEGRWRVSPGNCATA